MTINSFLSAKGTKSRFGATWWAHRKSSSQTWLGLDVPAGLIVRRSLTQNGSGCGARMRRKTNISVAIIRHQAGRCTRLASFFFFCVTKWDFGGLRPRREDLGACCAVTFTSGSCRHRICEKIRRRSENLCRSLDRFLPFLPFASSHTNRKPSPREKASFQLPSADSSSGVFSTRPTHAHKRFGDRTSCRFILKFNERIGKTNKQTFAPFSKTWPNERSCRIDSPEKART